MDKGAWFTWVPSAFACGLLRLFDMRKRAAIFRYSYMILLATLCAVLVVFVFGVCIVTTQEIKIGVEEYIILAWWMGFFFVFGFVKLNGILITLVIATFFTLVGHLIYRVETMQNSR